MSNGQPIVHTRGSVAVQQGCRLRWYGEAKNATQQTLDYKEFTESEPSRYIKMPHFWVGNHGYMGMHDSRLLLVTNVEGFICDCGDDRPEDYVKLPF